MHDCFAILGLERQPDLSDEELQAHYDERCRVLHPDAGGDVAEFQTLREAYELLLSPGKRLQHWLELSGGWKEGQDLDPAVSALFGTLGPLFQRGEELARRSESVSTALARSLLEREKLALMPEIESARAAVEEEIAGLVETVGRFSDPQWEANGEACRVARSLLFLERWTQQLRQLWMTQL